MEGGVLAGTTERTDQQRLCRDTKTQICLLSICRRRRVSDLVFGEEKSQVAGRRSQIWTLQVADLDFAGTLYYKQANSYNKQAYDKQANDKHANDKKQGKQATNKQANDKQANDKQANEPTQ